MNIIRKANPVRWLLAASLLFGVTASHAANGISVTRQQEAQVKVGMNAGEVTQLLGRPARNVQFRNEPGPLWFYDVIGMTDATIFEVAFSADGKVISTREYLDLTKNAAP